ncbi:MAG: hypothetical protein HYU67_06465 [Flavobacteriia bacterium]|nr:hypothetical protein [Flavobacteriia bacterium]
MKKTKALILLFLHLPIFYFAQFNQGNFTGNVETIFQYLNKDTVIGATQPPEKSLINTYMNVFYTHKNFKAGLRVESYLPRIQGYPDRFQGTGLGMRYVGYANDFLDLTLGNFYEQFGSGMVFRAYEDRALGYDNVMDGFRIILRPSKALTLKAVYGNQRLSFTGGQVIKAEGIVRGLDGELNINQLFPKFNESAFQFKIGTSFVSKFQKDNDPNLILPQNVASYGGRFSMRYKNFLLDGEYIQKENDPSNDNGYIYNKGHAALFNLSYTKKGLGIILSAKSVDNMSFRSDRSKDLQDVFINFLPAMNKTHTYNLVATLYPYTTQPLGEVSFQAEALYTIKKGTLLGGKYGVPINVNFSTAYKPMQHTLPFDSSLVTYKGRVFDLSDSLLWQDFNINITKKFNKKWTIIASYFAIRLNNDVTKVTNFAKGIINANISVLELNYRFNSVHSVRAELQSLLTKKDNGDWFTAVLEYNVSPHWFVSVMDQYNYGNPVSSKQLHYIVGTFGYIRDASRIMFSYGRQRAGLFCVGGICRFVPASNGLTVSFTHSF